MKKQVTQKLQQKRQICPKIFSKRKFPKLLNLPSKKKTTDFAHSKQLYISLGNCYNAKQF